RTLIYSTLDVNMATLGANFEGRSLHIGRGQQGGMDSGSESEVVERLFGCGSGLILFELCRFDNHTLRPFPAHCAHIQNKIETVRIVPVSAEHRHEPAAARLIDLLYIMARGRVGQILP